MFTDERIWGKGSLRISPRSNIPQVLAIALIFATDAPYITNANASQYGSSIAHACPACWKQLFGPTNSLSLFAYHFAAMPLHFDCIRSGAGGACTANRAPNVLPCHAPDTSSS